VTPSESDQSTPKAGVRRLGRLALTALSAVIAIGSLGIDASGASKTGGRNQSTSSESNADAPSVAPAEGGHGVAIGGMGFDVGQFGYREREFYFGGTARSYPPMNLPPQPYRSRMIVWTPKNPARFNGTTVVEWAEVSDFGRFELTVELNYQASMLMAHGYAFALVSAEQRGVCQMDVAGCLSSSLVGADPARYGSLHHPGDAYSFDIFSQAMQALKHPTGVAPLGKLKTNFVIAEGFQRSVDKYFPLGAPKPKPGTPPSPFGVYGPINDYIANGADRDARVADAFLVDAAAPANPPKRSRVPTLYHLDESAIRREPVADARNRVTWEVTGASHSDRWAGKHIHLPSPDPPKPKLSRSEEIALSDEFDNFGQVSDPTSTVCAPGPRAGNQFPRRFTLNAAVASLRRWLVRGERAPAAPRIQRVEQAPTNAAEKLKRDRDGNALGGLRLPFIQVPVAAYDGEACIEAGTSTPFTAKRLEELYPSHEAYVRKLRAATNRAVRSRYLLCEDAETIMSKASAAPIGGTRLQPAAVVNGAGRPSCRRRL
jgi:hypothetical protein